MKKTVLILGASLAIAASGTAFAGGDAAAGKEKSATCAGCHGVDGNSPTPAYPIIAGQYEDYLVQALAAYQNGQRSNAIMQGMVAALSEQDIADLAAYFASQEGPLKVVPHE